MDSPDLAALLGAIPQNLIRPPFHCELFGRANERFKVLHYERNEDGLHFALPIAICSTWQLGALMFSSMPDAEPRYHFAPQITPLRLVRVTNDATLNVPVYHYAPQSAFIVVPAIEQSVMHGARNLHGRLALLDEGGAVIADATAPILSITSKKRIETPAQVSPLVGEPPGPAYNNVAPIPPAAAPPSPQQVRAQNLALLAQAAAQLGVLPGVIHEVDSTSLRIILERFFQEFRQPCWALRPSSSRLGTFVLGYIDCSGAQPGVAERQVELVGNALGQLQFIRILTDESDAAPCALTLPELLQRFFPYLQVAITPTAYRRDIPRV